MVTSRSADRPMVTLPEAGSGYVVNFEPTITISSSEPSGNPGGAVSGTRDAAGAGPGFPAPAMGTAR